VVLLLSTFSVDNFVGSLFITLSNTDVSRVVIRL